MTVEDLRDYCLSLPGGNGENALDRVIKFIAAVYVFIYVENGSVFVM